MSHFTEVGKCRNLFTPTLAHLTLSLAARERSASELCKGKGERRRRRRRGGGGLEEVEEVIKEGEGGKVGKMRWRMGNLLYGDGEEDREKEQ